MDLCEEAVQWPGTWISKRWREHEGLDLEGAREVSEVAVEG